MTRALNKFVKSIADRIANAEAVRNMVILTPTDFIVRGFLFERRPVKNSYYIWRLIMPLFSPVMPSISLNYSDRISLDGRTQAYIRIDEAADELSRAIAEQMICEQIPKLDKINSVQVFLSAFEASGLDWRPNTKLELAFARLLCGDLEGGEKMINEILRLPPDSPVIPIVQEEARRLVEALRQGPASLVELASQIKKRNCSAFFPNITSKVGV